MNKYIKCVLWLRPSKQTITYTVIAFLFTAIIWLIPSKVDLSVFDRFFFIPLLDLGFPSHLIALGFTFLVGSPGLFFLFLLVRSLIKDYRNCLSKSQNQVSALSEQLK